MSNEDYRLTTQWPSGRETTSYATDVESAELFQEFYEAEGAQSVIITPPSDTL